MKANQLINLLLAVPDDASVYFRIPAECSEGEECSPSVFEYNDVLNQVTLSWDCIANYEYPNDQIDYS